ncbi:MAG: M20/M25/M40 family metallo-hydrolase [Oscillospiraceae bacterium]
MDIKKVLLELSAASGTSGKENKAADLGEQLLSKFGKVQRTPLGSLICTVKKPKKGQPNIMLEAHIDEIGLVVTNIDSKGFLKVSNIGGIDRNVVMAAPVTIHTKDENIKAVICSIPSYIEDDHSKLPKVDELSIDTGLSKEEVEKRVRLGDSITFDSTPADLLNNTICTKAEDDRACCLILLRACEMLKDADYDCGLSVVFGTMEEVGGQGAQTATAIVKPTHAIACDVSFAFTPDIKPHQCGVMGKGGMISYAPILNDEMTDKLVEIAKEQEIPYQIEVSGGSTGTDADSIAIYDTGVKTALISLAQRYMHTIIETVSLDDIENTAKLMAEFVKTLR